MRSFEVTPERFPKKEVDSASMPWNEAWSSDGEGMRIKLILDELGRAKASECFSEELILPDGDGRFVLEADLPNHECLPRYILSFGDHAEVFSPPVLREKVAELALRLHQRHI
jgi:predicted DNA-binding transcriptional regulator YafY